jgi:ribosome biogenesis GTPase A
VIEAIAKKRGCLLKGKNGEFDLEKAAMILLTEYRSGKLGRISLQAPESHAAD